MIIILDNKHYLLTEEECQVALDKVILTLTDSFIEHNYECSIYLYKQQRFKEHANFLLQVVHEEHIIDFNGCNIHNIEEEMYDVTITISYKTFMVKHLSQQIPLKEVIQSLQQQLI